MDSRMQAMLTQLKLEFIQKLPGRMVEIESLSELIRSDFNRHLEPFHRTVHSLVGAAAMHKLTLIADTARQLEYEIAALSDAESVSEDQLLRIKMSVQHLKSVMESPESGSFESEGFSHINANVNTIMVVDDDTEQSSWISSVLVQHGYKVEVFNELAQFISAVKNGAQPAAVVMDMMFPEGDSAGAAAINRLKQETLLGLPVIFLSASDCFDAKLTAYRAGATRYLTKPVDQDLLLGAIAEHVALIPNKPFRILLVDDDQAQLEFTTHVLQAAGLEVKGFNNPVKVLDGIKNFYPEAIVLDMYMPECSGPELATILHETPEYSSVPIIYLSAETDVSKQLMALNRGGDHFLTKSIEPQHLVTAVSMHARKHRQIHEQVERMKASLYEKERQYQALNTHAIVTLLDMDGQVIDVNQNLIDVSGYAYDELIGQSFNLFNTSVHSEAFYNHIWQTIKTGKVWQGKVAQLKKDGNHYWVEMTITPFMGSDNKPYQFIVICTDITSIKLSEDRTRLAQKYAHYGIWEWNIVSGDLQWSEPVWQLFGLNVGETALSFEMFSNAIHPDDRDDVLSAIDRCIELGQEFSIEHRVIRSDGSIHWLQGQGDVTRDEHGNAINMLGIVQDVTIKKESQLRLEQSQSRLKEAQELAHIGNWEANLQTGEVVWSDEVFTIFGQDPTQFTPSVEGFAEMVHPEDRDLVSEHEKQSITSGEYDVVHRIVLPMGEIRYVHELAQVFTDHNGDIVTLRGTAQDVTPLKLIEQDLIEAKLAAEKANLLKSQFLANMSHEIRTPMNAILGFIQILKDSETDQEKLQYLTTIDKSSQSLLNIINDILDFSKIENNELATESIPFHLRNEIDATIALFHSHASAKGIDLYSEFSEALPAQIQSDPLRLKQVLSNLLSNAIKFSKSGGQIELSFGYDSGTQHLQVSVQDHGVGICADKQQLIFEPFLQADVSTTRKYGGTGLGLAISKRLIENMGGTLKVQSQKGSGSRFVFEVPAKASEVKQAAPKLLSEINLEALKGHVLLVEDNLTNQLLIRKLIEKTGLTYELANDGLEAIDMFSKSAFDLILMDENMPRMNGSQATQKIREMEKEQRNVAKNTPIVALTANSMKEDRQRFLDAGMDDYLSKPINVLKLYQVIAEQLDKTTP